ncbi:MAG: hypothetical protein KDC93_04715 [Cyclobacteriaceae bacterium]|nr:hypothetical protein [Cyclobacteriaceae bacterium]
MKIVLLFALTLTSIQSFGQENTPKDSLFVVTYTTGPAWDFEKSPNDQPYFSEHSKHLSTLRKNGTIKLGARSGEKGIIVFSAKTLKEAKEIINSDIAIVNSLFETDIQAFNVFYPGCVER